MIELDRLAQIVASHDRKAHETDVARADQQRADAVALFPKAQWPTLSLDDYALGQAAHPENFCRWMEFVTVDIGSIKGGSARKHFIYFQTKVGDWWFDSKLYETVDEAWTTVRNGFVEALALGDETHFEEVDSIDALRSGPALVTKTLHLYFPDALLPIFAQAHLRHYLRKLGDPKADDGTLGTASLNRLLLQGLRAAPDIASWSTKELERLLYSSELSPFLAPVFTTPIDDPAAFIRASLEEATDERLVARREAEDKARQLLDEHAGSMTEEQFRNLLALFNADFHDGKPAKQRFVPAFFGHTANGLMARLDLVNDYTSRIWRGSPDQAVAAITELLDDRRALPSAGSSYPTILMYLRDPETHAVWIPSTDAGLRRLSAVAPGRRAAVGKGSDYDVFRDAAEELMHAHDIPPELLDFVLSSAARFEVGKTPKPAGSVWLFQANPTMYAIDEALANEDRIDWVVRQYESEVHAGDRVYIWRSGTDGGVVATATVATEPTTAAAPPDDPYVLDAAALSKPEPRVELLVDAVAMPPLSRAEVAGHPALQQLGVLTFANATNYRVTAEQDAALKQLLAGAVGQVEVPLRAATDDLGARVHLQASWIQAEVIELLADKRQLVFYGPPGTGKTFVAQRVAEHLTQEGGAHELIQFHPSYSYEDFFEGYRPVEIDGGTGVTYKLTPGPLRRMVERAKKDRSNPYVLVIDEINRGNVPKIFGELLFLLEYRDAAIPLQYSPHEKFKLPSNVFVIATMNTADRSIALIDAALRRRFYFVAFMPHEEPIRGVLRSWLKAAGLDDEPARLMEELNKRLASNEFAIGPSYFMTRDATAPDLERVWKHAIAPLLEEHYFGVGRDLSAEFGLDALRKALDAAPGAGAEVAVEEQQSPEN